MNKKIILFIFLFTTQVVVSQNVVIKGNAKSYAGDTLKIYTPENYITNKKHQIAKSFVDKKGNFKFEFQTNNTIEIFFDLNVFEGILYTQPNKKYNIILPVKTEKDQEDKLNPYFSPIQFYVKQTGEKIDSLNYSITDFDKFYNRLYVDVLQKVKHGNSYKVNDIEKKINDSTSNFNDEFYKSYKFYKTAGITSFQTIKNTSQNIYKYFANKKILYNNPAYNETLRLLTKNYILKFKNDSGQSIILKNTDWQQLNNILEKQEEINDSQFLEYLLLTNLYDIFYIDKNYRKPVIEILKQCTMQSKISRHITLAQEILAHIAILVEEQDAPEFSLLDKNLQNVKTSDFKGKFIYLNFYNHQSYACQKDMEALKLLDMKKIDKLEIITIWTEPEIENMIKEIKNNNINWTVLHTKPESELLKTYKVISYPTYLLINPEGKLLLYPAPGPADNFEAAYFHHYTIWNREQIRKNKDKKQNSLIPN